MTPRESAETGADLPQQVEQWATVLDAMPDAVAILDTQHRVVFANRSMAQRLGTTQDDCVGQTCFACVHGADGPPASCPHSKMLADGLEHHAQIHEELLGGDFLVSVSPLFDTEGRLAGAVHVARDITAQIRADEVARESEQRFRETAELLPQIVYEMDLQGRLTFVNRNAFEIFGYTQEDFQAGVNNLDMLVPEERERACQNVVRVLRGEDLTGNEYMAQRKDGHRFPIVVYSAPIIRGGRPVGLRGIIVDITQRKEEERALAEAKDAAEAADRAKSEFLTNVSHEIRTPLTSITSFAELLAKHDLPTPEVREHARTIGRNAKHLLTLVNDILDLSKIEAGKIELELMECSPLRVAEEVQRLLLVSAQEKQLQLEIHYALPLPRFVRTDPVRLRQILVNLVGNAVKFTEEGSVRITVRGCHPAGSGSQLRFEVADTGIGMTRDEVQRIFEAFTQADTSHTRRFGGTGLGLSISRKLATILGGEIEVESELGKGSTFTLCLDAGPVEGTPTLPTSEIEAAEKAEPASGKQGHQIQGRILLVEDDADVRAAIRIAVETSGAQVDTAENGQIAIQKAFASKAAGQPYDLILMDIQMPKIDGYETTRRLRQGGWEAPVIALTAHVGADDREKCLKAGCDDYLTKPLARADLIGTLARHMKTAATSPRVPTVIPGSTAPSPTVPTDGCTSGT